MRDCSLKHLARLISMSAAVPWNPPAAWWIMIVEFGSE